MTAARARRNRYLCEYFSGQLYKRGAVSIARELRDLVAMAMQQLIYASRPFGYDASDLASILAASQVRNAQSDITGALICRPDIYLQLLEGPIGQVENTFDRIQRDDRHVEVRVLVRSQITDRLFPQWAMRHDPAKSWLWSPREVAQGVLDRVSAREVRAVFLRLAEETGL